MTILFTRTLTAGRLLTCTIIDGEPVFDVDGTVIPRLSMGDVDSIDKLRGKKWAEQLVEVMAARGASHIWNYQICLFGDEPALIAAARTAYYDRPEIRLPREREELVHAVNAAWAEVTYQRERDYNNDIGFHASPAAEKIAKTAELALKEFDAANPEIATKIATEEAEKTARQIQSALNS